MPRNAPSPACAAICRCRLPCRLLPLRRHPRRPHPRKSRDDPLPSSASKGADVKVRPMYRIVSLLAVFAAGTAMAQTPPARGTAQSQPPSSFYPAPPPDQAPQVQQGAPTTDLTSPLAANQSKATRTEITSDTEAQLLSGANKIVWGRYAKIKGAKPGDVVTAKNNGL